jgi:outer membrane protein assembly factor BamC
MPVLTAHRSTRALRGAAVLGAALALAGCSTLNVFGGRIDHRAEAGRTAPLEVPPDLTQLARDPRFAPQAGVVSAVELQAAAGAAPRAVPGAPQGVAIDARGEFRIERDGDARWLVSPLPPEQMWPRVRDFWQQRGFTIVNDNAEAGVMETEWREDRARIPQDIIRATLGRILDQLWATGERDQYRTRIERRADGGSEVFISHRGLVEVFVAENREATRWTHRPSDPQLEALMLTGLMTTLGVPAPQAQAAVAAATPRPERARVLAGQPGAALQVDEPFDRAWRRVGLALDRAGFTVEDRDRAVGVYFVRYVDAATQARQGEQPGWLGRLFGAREAEVVPQRFRIAVRRDGDARSTVAVLDAQGAPVAGATPQRIVQTLVADLR